MAGIDIHEELSQIRGAVYGEEVRGAIVDALEEMAVQGTEAVNTAIIRAQEATNAAGVAVGYAEIATNKAQEATNQASISIEKATEASLSADLASNKAQEATNQASISIEKATEASLSADNAYEFKNIASEKAQDAAISASNAADSAEESSSKTAEADNYAKKAYNSAIIATTKAEEAENSENNAADSANTANLKATQTEFYTTLAEGYKNTATSKASEASTSANNAGISATNAETYAKQAQSYAIGTGNVRPNEEIDNSKYYYEQAKAISESFSGALRPMGTVSFENLPALENASESDMYNISDQFTTTTDFKEGAGFVIPAGSNIYKTTDGMWDVLAGTPVTSVNGKTGNVEIEDVEFVNGKWVQTPAPSFIQNGKNRFVAMDGFKGINNINNNDNTPIRLDTILMDNDVDAPNFSSPYVTAIGITKNTTTPRMLIANGLKNNTEKWNKSAEVITTENISSQSVSHSDLTGIRQHNAYTNEGEGWYRFLRIRSEGIYLITIGAEYNTISPSLHSFILSINNDNNKLCQIASNGNEYPINSVRTIFEPTMGSHRVELYNNSTDNNIVEWTVIPLVGISNNIEVLGLQKNTDSSPMVKSILNFSNYDFVGDIKGKSSTSILADKAKNFYRVGYFKINTPGWYRFAKCTKESGTFLISINIIGFHRQGMMFLCSLNSENEPRITMLRNDVFEDYISNIRFIKEQEDNYFWYIDFKYSYYDYSSIYIDVISGDDYVSPIEGMKETNPSINSAIYSADFDLRYIPIEIGYMATCDKNTNGGIAIGGVDALNTRNTVSFGEGAIAIGDGAQATDDSGISIGATSTVDAYCGVALGYGSIVHGASSVAIGLMAMADESEYNTIKLGNSWSLSALKCRVALSVTSDERDKTDFKKIDKALEFINKIIPYTYVDNNRAKYAKNVNDLTDDEKEIYKKYGHLNYDEKEHLKGTKKGERRRSGVSAQQTIEALIDTYGSSDVANIVNDNLHDLKLDNGNNIPENVENHLTVTYESFIPYLIGALQELTEQYNQLKERVNILEKGGCKNESN